MTVPKAPVNKNRNFVSGENKIRATWKVCVVQPKPKTGTVECASHRQFRLRVAPSNVRHHSRANWLCDSVDHLLSELSDGSDQSNKSA